MDLLAGPGQRGAAALRLGGAREARVPNRQAEEPGEGRDGRIGPRSGAGTFIGSPSPFRHWREFLFEPSGSPPVSPYQPMMMPPPRRGGISLNSLVLVIGLFLGVLIFAGTLSFHAALLIPVPCQGGSVPTYPAGISYRDSLRSLRWGS